MEYSIDDFVQCLARHETATQALNHWCRQRRLPGAHAVHANVLCDATIPHHGYAGAIDVAPHETLRHRRVCLSWGDIALSEADNWYLPDRLPAAMREQLEHTTVPFGQVIKMLRPLRRQTAVQRDPEASGPQTEGCRFILHVSAVMHAADGTPVAEVREHYRRELICPPGTPAPPAHG